MNSFGIFHLLILVLLAGIFFVLYLYAKTYKSLLQAIGPRYTSLNPNLPYLVYVPVVGLIFYAVMAFSLKGSLARLHQDGKVALKTDAVFKSLLAFCVCTALTVVPMIDQFMMLLSLICWGFNWSHATNTRTLVVMGASK